MAPVFVVFMLLAIIFSVAIASDPSPLQDFCVADLNSRVMVNGFICKNSSSVQVDDFYFSGLHVMANTSNTLGLGLTRVTVSELPGLNTLGIIMVRIDYAPWGITPPHMHSGATEIFFVLEGSLKVGFVTSNPENRHISKILNKGDVFVFPANLVHYQRNIGKTNAVAIVALSSQRRGVILVPNGVFGSKPHISPDVLAKAFQTSDDVITNIELRF